MELYNRAGVRRGGLGQTCHGESHGALLHEQCCFDPISTRKQEYGVRNHNSKFETETSMTTGWIYIGCKIETEISMTWIYIGCEMCVCVCVCVFVYLCMRCVFFCVCIYVCIYVYA